MDENDHDSNIINSRKIEKHVEKIIDKKSKKKNNTKSENLRKWKIFLLFNFSRYIDLLSLIDNEQM